MSHSLGRFRVVVVELAGLVRSLEAIFTDPSNRKVNARFVQFWICMCSLYGIARVNGIQNDIQMQNARFVQFWICMCNLYGAAILQPAGIPYKLHVQTGEFCERNLSLYMLQITHFG